MTFKRVQKLRYRQRTLILLVIAVIVFLLLVMFAPLTDITLWGIDVYTFRAGAKAMALGESPYYEPNILRFADGATVGNIHNFTYAPFFGFVLRPLTWFEPEFASRLWLLLNIIFYIAAIGLLIKAIDWTPTSGAMLMALLGLMLYPPLRTTLIIGQNTLFLLFWFSLSYFLLKRSKPVWSGLSLTLALFKPHLAPLLLFYAIKQQWRLILGFALGVVITTLPFLNYISEWINTGVATYGLNMGEGGCFRMVSVTAMVECFVPLGWSLMVTAVLVVVTFIFLLPYFWKDRAVGPVFDRHIALYIVAILLLLNNVRVADQMLLVLPLLVVWRDWHRIQGSFRHRLAIALMMIIYVIPYVIDFLQPYSIAFILPLWYVGVSLSVAGLLLLQIQPAHTANNLK